jgi:cytochrome P450
VARAMDAVMAHIANPAVSFSRLPEWFPTPSKLRYREAVRQIDAIIGRIIRQRQSGQHDPGDLLGRLLAARDDGGGRMSDAQMRDELVTLFLAGHETTALSLAYCFYLLATHPEAEARWQTELDTVLEGRPPTAADVPRLMYTDWIVRESMRLYPPAWTIAREALADCQIGGFHIPQGAQLWPVQWIVHRDPRWFDRPDEFLPERWDGDLARRLPRCAYFPFGDGPRICIGQSFAMLEAVLILATIGQRMRLTVRPGFRLQLAPSITLRPKHGIAMSVHVRSRATAAAGKPA